MYDSDMGDLHHIYVRDTEESDPSSQKKQETAAEVCEAGVAEQFEVSRSTRTSEFVCNFLHVAWQPSQPVLK